MLKKRLKVLLFPCLSATILFCGCAQKRIESTAVPGQPGAGENTASQKGDLADSGRYLVEKHDCLWTIAQKPVVYGDSFQWPELFKGNRDEIKDPDLIYPNQELRVEKGISQEEMAEARKMAMATPKYVPHTKPRETLPVDYF